MTAPSSTPRFEELINTLRAEYDRVSAENQSYKTLRKEWTRKLEDQASELNTMLAEFHDLERKHQLVKDQYEAEIMRLKGQTPPNPPPPASVAASAALPQTSSLNVNKRRPLMPESTHPAYPTPIPSDPQQSLPAMFPPRVHPTSLARGHPPQSAAPPSSQSAGPMGVVGLSSIPSAPPNGAPIPSVNPPVPGPAVMPPVHNSTVLGARIPGVVAPTPGSQTRDSAHVQHPVKKDPSMPIDNSITQPSMPSHQPASALAAATSPRPNSLMPPPNSVNASGTGTEDWAVYQGRAANGSVVDMRVNLQNSLALESVVCCVRYSWDGQYLATGSNRSAHIFEAATGRTVASFSKDMGSDRDDGNGQDSYVRAVCFSPDGNWLITGAEDHVVKVWDVRSRKVKHRLVGHGTDIYSVDASANSQFIISGSGDKKAKLWNLETGKLQSTLGDGEMGPTDGITSVSVSPSSQHVAAGSLDKIVRVWEVESSRLVRQFEGHRDSVYSVAFSPDGRTVLSGSLDKTLKLWDLAAEQHNQCRLSFTGHKDFVLSVAFCPDGRWLISGSKDRTVQFWDPRQSTMCLMLQGHKNSVISIAHNPRSNSLATGSGDCRARTWVYS